MLILFSSFLFTLLTLGLLFFAILQTIFKIQRKHKVIGLTSQGSLPGPTSLPFIGGIVQVGILLQKNGMGSGFYDGLCKKYGSRVVGFQCGSQHFVLVSDLSTAKTVFNSEDWTSRFPSHPMYSEITLGKNVGVSFSSGSSWKENRRFILRTLRGYGFGEKHTMETSILEESTQFLTYFDEELKKAESTQGSPEICMQHQFNLSALNIIWRLINGTRFSCHDEEMKYFIRLINCTNAQLSPDACVLVAAFPFLRKVPGLTKFGKAVGMFEELQMFLKKVMAARKESGTYRDSQENFIDTFLKRIEDEGLEGNNTNNLIDHLIQSCVDLVLAGSDTTSSSLEYTILYLLIHPEVQGRVQEEIDRVIGPDQLPKLSDREKLTYIEATILEILRCCPVLPIVTRACTVVDTELLDCRVLKDSVALVNVKKINMDPEFWGDPQNFRPERFLDPSGKIIKNLEHGVMTFGAGKRVCIGLNVARSTFFLFFVRLFQKYDFCPSPNHPELSTEDRTFGSSSVPKPYYCVVRKRQNVAYSL